MRKLRMKCLAPRGNPFPFYFSPVAVSEHFDLVETNPDVVVLINLNVADWRGRSDLAPSLRALDGPTPTVLFHSLDRWDWPDTSAHDGGWLRTAMQVANEADFVFGNQLPASFQEAWPKRVPLFVPSIVPELDAAPVPFTSYDLSFVGEYSSERGAEEPLRESASDPGEVRTRAERARQIALLQTALGGEARLHFEDRTFWSADQLTRARLLKQYARTLDASRVVFSPPGLGYNCCRHAEAMARRRLLLVNPLHERILVPEATLWREQRICVTYRWDAADLVDRARFALHADHSDRIDEAARYYRRWGRSDVQVALVARHLVEHL